VQIIPAFTGGQIVATSQRLVIIQEYVLKPTSSSERPRNWEITNRASSYKQTIVATKLMNDIGQTKPQTILELQCHNTQLRDDELPLPLSLPKTCGLILTVRAPQCDANSDQ
jgi:hypothetical protein